MLKTTLDPTKDALNTSKPSVTLGSCWARVVRPIVTASRYSIPVRQWVRTNEKKWKSLSKSSRRHTMASEALPVYAQVIAQAEDELTQRDDESDEADEIDLDISEEQLATEVGRQIAAQTCIRIDSNVARSVMERRYENDEADEAALSQAMNQLSSRKRVRRDQPGDSTATRTPSILTQGETDGNELVSILLADEASSLSVPVAPETAQWRAQLLHRLVVPAVVHNTKFRKDESDQEALESPPSSLSASVPRNLLAQHPELVAHLHSSSSQNENEATADIVANSAIAPQWAALRMQLWNADEILQVLNDEEQGMVDSQRLARTWLMPDYATSKKLISTAFAPIVTHQPPQRAAQLAADLTYGALSLELMSLRQVNRPNRSNVKDDGSTELDADTPTLSPFVFANCLVSKKEARKRGALKCTMGRGYYCALCMSEWLDAKLHASLPLPHAAAKSQETQTQVGHADDEAAITPAYTPKPTLFKTLGGLREHLSQVHLCGGHFNVLPISKRIQALQKQSRMFSARLLRSRTAAASDLWDASWRSRSDQWSDAATLAKPLAQAETSEPAESEATKKTETSTPSTSPNVSERVNAVAEWLAMRDKALLDDALSASQGMTAQSSQKYDDNDNEIFDDAGSVVLSDDEDAAFGAFLSRSDTVLRTQMHQTAQLIASQQPSQQLQQQATPSGATAASATSRPISVAAVMRPSMIRSTDENAKKIIATLCKSAGLDSTHVMRVAEQLASMSGESTPEAQAHPLAQVMELLAPNGTEDLNAVVAAAVEFDEGMDGAGMDDTAGGEGEATGATSTGSERLQGLQSDTGTTARGSATPAATPATAAAASGTAAGLGEKRKRVRRTTDLNRPYPCQVPGCNLAYGTAQALRTHVRNKHPDLAADMRKPQGRPPRHPGYMASMPSGAGGLSVGYGLGMGGHYMDYDDEEEEGEGDTELGYDT